MKTPRVNPFALSPFDPITTKRDEEYVDSGFDELGGDDHVADYGGRAARLRDEDGAW